MLYVAELEDKIKQEQEAREKLALMYDTSLTTGYTRLQSETANLSQNPLIHEVTEPGPVGGYDPTSTPMSERQFQMLQHIRQKQYEAQIAASAQVYSSV